MKGFWIAFGLGAIATAAFLLSASSVLPFNMEVWFFVALIASAGGALSGGLFLAWQRVRGAPIALLNAALILMVPTLLFAVLTYKEVRATRAFLAIADSTRGSILLRYTRGGEFLRVHYITHGTPNTIWAPLPWNEPSLTEGDSVSVYYRPERPDSARVGRPAVNFHRKSRDLAWFWGIIGTLLLGYVPQLSRWPVRGRAQKRAT